MRHSTRITGCLVSFGITLVLSSASASAQCVLFDKPEELFAHNDTVFTGTVVMNEPTSARGEHQIVAVATLRVDKSWKGRLEREVRVGSDAAFEVGKKYLVFAGGKPLSTTILCRASEPIERAKSKLDWLAATQK